MPQRPGNPPRSDDNDTDHYVIRIPGDQLKNQKPELISIADPLTPYYRFYVARILPEDWHGAFWRTEQDTPRVEFGPPVKQLVAAIIDNRIGPLRLRAAIATHHSSSSMSDSEGRELGRVMDHSVMVSDRCYVEARGRVETQHKLAQQMDKVAEAAAE